MKSLCLILISFSSSLAFAANLRCETDRTLATETSLSLTAEINSDSVLTDSSIRLKELPAQAEVIAQKEDLAADPHFKPRSARYKNLDRYTLGKSDDGTFQVVIPKELASKPAVKFEGYLRVSFDKGFGDVKHLSCTLN